MGTRLDAVFIDIDGEKADNVSALIKNVLNDLEDILSLYRRDSELSRLNRTAFEKDIEVSSGLFEAISLCMDYFKLTNGAFDAGKALLTAPDIAVKTSLPGNQGQDGESSGMALVELNKAKRTVRYHGPDLMIDSGGFGKGFAMRRVKEILISEGVINALVSFGESSVLAIGAHPYGTYWPIAVSNIYDRNSVARMAKLNSNSISTSGTGFVDEHGMFKPAHNIFDPRTGRSVDDPMTLSVISDDPFESEVLSTALLIDINCLSDKYNTEGREAFAVIYDLRKNFVLKEIF